MTGKNQPLSGNAMPRFAGLATMMRLPAATEAAGLTLDVGQEVLRIALHLVIVFVVRRLVVVQKLNELNNCPSR